MRVAVMAAAICLSIVGLSAAGDSKAAIRRDTHIPAGGLGPALQTLAKTYDFQVLYRTEVVGDLRTQGAAGTMTAPEALKQVLSGTGLSFKYLDDNTVTIIPITPSAAPLSSSQSAGGTAPTQGANPQQKEGKKDSSGGFLLAQVAQGAPASSPTVEKKNEQVAKLEEVIVTAQKRNERLQDVPVPVTALSANTLLDSNQVRIEDFYTQVPGLSVTPDDLLGTARITIRGISTGGFSNPTVGVVVDDVPYGSSTGLGYGYAAPDIDPADLVRIEVLRGPQGTLYGADAMGGLLKYVTVDPSMDRLSGRVQADGNSVQNGDKVGYGLRGSVNVPLSDTLAIRASAFGRQDPGYIDDPVLHVDGVNRADVYGGRLAALWRPSDGFSLKLSALFQERKAYGQSLVEQTVGDLQQSVARNSGRYDKQIQAYSATLAAQLGIFELTSITGLNINKDNYWFDLTPVFGTYTQQQFGVTGTPTLDVVNTTKFTQEIRVTAPIGPQVDWLFGVFYNHESSPQTEWIYATDFATGSFVGTWLDEPYPSTFAEYAAFTDITFRITDRLNIQLGGRESHNKQTYSQSQTGPYVPFFLGVPSPVVQPETQSNDNSFTYLVTPQLKVSSDMMIYARLASGYRPGGPNTSAAPGSGVPPTYAPDKTQNYELGIKGRNSGHSLSYDLSLYYIDWKAIQLNLIAPVTQAAYFANGSEAKSEGVEFSVEANPFRRLTVSAWVAYNEAELTQPMPTNSAVYAVQGDRLPTTPRFSGSLSAQDEFPVSSRVTGFVGGSVSYVSDRFGLFTAPPPAIPPRQVYPSYAQTDLRAGVKYDDWTLNLFVNNAADKRAALTGGLGTTYVDYFQVIQPRAIGLSVVRKF